MRGDEWMHSSGGGMKCLEKGYDNIYFFAFEHFSN